MRFKTIAYFAFIVQITKTEAEVKEMYEKQTKSGTFYVLYRRYARVGYTRQDNAKPGNITLLFTRSMPYLKQTPTSS